LAMVLAFRLRCRHKMRDADSWGLCCFVDADADAACIQTRKFGVVIEIIVCLICS
jgi:hypothetical protein